MATHKLSEFTVRSVKPTDKIQKLADGHDLYLEVTPPGSKQWRYRYEGKFKLTPSIFGRPGELRMMEWADI